MAIKLAAGPETLTWEPLKYPTTKPPIIPVITPENAEAPEAPAIPKQRGRATKNTTIPDKESVLKEENNDLGLLIDVPIYSLSFSEIISKNFTLEVQCLMISNQLSYSILGSIQANCMVAYSKSIR